MANLSKKRPVKRHQIFFDDSSLTKQSFAEEANINTIMRRYEQTGILPDPVTKNKMYGDFSNVTSYQEALDKLALAQSQFDSLPARIRKEFDNSPYKFVEFASNPDNLDAMVEMGLAEPRIDAVAAPAAPAEEETPPDPTPPTT